MSRATLSNFQGSSYLEISGPISTGDFEPLNMVLGSSSYSLGQWPETKITSRLTRFNVAMPEIVVVKESLIETQTAICRSLRALRARNPPKVSKKSPRASGLRVSKKSRKESKSLKKVSKKTFLTLFWGFLTLFETFWTLWARRLGETFLRLLGHFGPGGPGDSCKWPFGSQRLKFCLITCLKSRVQNCEKVPVCNF